MIGLALARAYQFLLANAALVFLISLGQLGTGFFLFLGIGRLTPAGSAVVLGAILLCLVLWCVLVAGGAFVLDARFRGESLPGPRAVLIAALGPGLVLALALFGAMVFLTEGAALLDGFKGAQRVAAAVVFIWLMIVAIQGAFVFAACSVIHGRAGSAACRDALLLTFGNPVFSLTIPILVLLPGLLTLGLVPGPSGLLAVFADSARLRLRRYAAGDPRNPDWSQLLSIEIEAQSKRRLGTILFPWRNL
jgi:hypothetical protein